MYESIDNPGIGRTLSIDGFITSSTYGYNSVKYLDLDIPILAGEGLFFYVGIPTWYFNDVTNGDVYASVPAHTQ